MMTLEAVIVAAVVVLPEATVATVGLAIKIGMGIDTIVVMPRSVVPVGVSARR